MPSSTDSNVNKRILESPPEVSIPKRNNSGKSPSGTKIIMQDGNEALTKSSLRDVLKEELNAALDEKLVSLATKNDVVKISEQVIQLKDGVCNQEKRLNQIEWKQRSKNLIFKNIPQKTEYKPYITSLLHNIMQLKHICPGSIYTLKTIKEKKLVIVLVEFSSNEDVRDIIRKVQTLKGTNIIIERDLSAEERERKGLLLVIRREVLRKAAENDVSVKVVVSDNKIKFDSTVFLFDKTCKDFVCRDTEVEPNLVLRDYLRDSFDIHVNELYRVIINSQ